jgi:uncharacterized cupin superfamily protein
LIRTTIIAAALLAAGAASAQTGAQTPAQPAGASAELKPIKIPQADALGPVFSRPGAVSRPGDGKRAAIKGFPIFRSDDKTMTVGLADSGPGEAEWEAYPHNEFMYFIKGHYTLISADGTVMEFGPGDSVTVPKGWKGRRTTTGYTKYYVTYGPK